MELPRVRDTDFTERLGVNAVDYIVTRARCIWRETFLRDVGIDGQIEHVTDDGRATGRMVLVQVKSGPSYFRRQTESHILYTPDDRHRNYWGHAPLPVILCLHNPDDERTIWVDARREIQQGRSDPIQVPCSQTFDISGVHLALQSDAGPLPIDPMKPEEILSEMRVIRTNNASCNLSFLDLFVHGLTDICHSVYFGMDLVMEIAEARLANSGSPFGVGIGGDEYEFLDRYISFIAAHDLVRFN